MDNTDAKQARLSRGGGSLANLKQDAKKKGDLIIRVVEAKDLRGLEATSSTRYENPHCQVSLAGSVNVKRTTAAESVAEPAWNETVELDLESLEEQQLLCSVMITQVDPAKNTKRRMHLGSVMIAIKPLSLDPEPQWHSLYKRAPLPGQGSSDPSVGNLFIQLRFQNAFEDLRLATSILDAMPEEKKKTLTLKPGFAPIVSIIADAPKQEEVIEKALQDKHLLIRSKIRERKSTMAKMQGELITFQKSQAAPVPATGDQQKLESELANMKRDVDALEQVLQSLPAAVPGKQGRSATLYAGRPGALSEGPRPGGAHAGRAQAAAHFAASLAHSHGAAASPADAPGAAALSSVGSAKGWTRGPGDRHDSHHGPPAPLAVGTSSDALGAGAIAVSGSVSASAGAAAAVHSHHHDGGPASPALPPRSPTHNYHGAGGSSAGGSSAGARAVSPGPSHPHARDPHAGDKVGITTHSTAQAGAPSASVAPSATVALAPSGHHAAQTGTLKAGAAGTINTGETYLLRLLDTERARYLESQAALSRVRELEAQRQATIEQKVAELESSLKQMGYEKQIGELQLQLERQSNELRETRRELESVRRGGAVTPSSSTHSIGAPAAHAAHPGLDAHQQQLAAAELEANPELKAKDDELDRRKMEVLSRLMKVQAPLALLRLKKKEEELRSLEDQLSLASTEVNILQSSSTPGAPGLDTVPGAPEAPMAPDAPPAPAMGDMDPGTPGSDGPGAAASPIPGFDLGEIMSKLEQLDKLDAILAKLANIGAVGAMAAAADQPKIGKTSAEVEKDMAEMMKIVLDPNSNQVDREDANIKYEKLAEQLERMPEFKEKKRLEELAKRELQKPVNEKALAKWKGHFAHANVAKDPSLLKIVTKNPELKLIGEDHKKILSMHNNDWMSFSLKGISLELLRAIYASLPDFRRDQVKQSEFKDMLALRIDEEEIKEEHKKNNPEEAAVKKPKKVVNLKLGSAAAAPGKAVSANDMLNELLSKRKRKE